MLDTGDCNSKAVSLQSPPVESGVNMSLLPLAEEVAAFKFFTLKTFLDETTELNGDDQKFSGKCSSLQTGLSGLNGLEISNSLNLSNRRKDVKKADVTNTESSAQASVSDGSHANSCCVLQSLDTNIATTENNEIEYDDVEILSQLLDKTEETAKTLECQGPLFSLFDLSSSDDASLFSPTNQFSSSVTDCGDGINDFSFSEDFAKDRMALNEMLCSFLTVSPEGISPLAQKFMRENNSEVEYIRNDFYSDFISSDCSKSSSIGNTGSIKRRICDSTAPPDTVPALKKRVPPSSTNLLENKIGRDLTYALNQRPSEQLKAAAAARSGYMSEFEKFIQSSSGDCLSEQIVATSGGSIDCQVPIDSMHLRRRSVRKPVCACCRAVTSDSPIPKQRCARKHVVAKRQCNVAKQSCAKSRKTLYSHTHLFEQLYQLQIRIFHLLHTLFPFIAGLVHLTPHSHSLELLLHEIISILKDSSHAPSQKLKLGCCPVVSLCCSPERCLRSLRRKTIALIKILFPSVCHGCTKISELDEIIDQIITVNK